MGLLPDHLTDLLERYLEDGDAAALDEACRQVTTQAIDIAALLDWVARYPAEARQRDLAVRALRAALRLPAMPGPPCRPHLR